MGHTPGWAIFIIVIILIPALAFVAYTVFSHYSARRHGLPAPPLNPFSDEHRIGGHGAPGGLKGWYHATVDRVRGGHSGGGGGSYEATTPRRFGALDPDEAWDARVGAEADGYGPGGYYEEQELGLHSTTHGAYEGSAYRQAPRLSREIGRGDEDGGYEVERGRSQKRQRELDARYAAETGMGPAAQNPFGDGAEPSDVSLRGVSPRPHEDGGLAAPRDSTERRSLFREGV